MKFYFYYDKCWEELIDCLKEYFKWDLVEDIKKADIIIFSNFSLLDRKFLLKNKNLWNKKKFFVYIQEPLIDNNDVGFNQKMIKRINYFPFLDIITYSKANLNYIKKYVRNRKYYYLPINYYNKKEFYSKKYIDGLLIHRNSSCK